MKIPRTRVMAFAIVIAIWVLAGSDRARADFIGPAFGPSPFDSMIFEPGTFKLIKMSDFPTPFCCTSFGPYGTFSVPGVTLSGASDAVVIGPGSLVDSADGGNKGKSLFSFCGACGFTFTFDAAVLGSLPTAAGIVWTDGDFKIHFSAVDANGNSIGSLTDSSGCDFSSCGDGDPDNYRFYGVTDSIGVKSITISNDVGGIEVDHLQFGVLAPTSAVPEPGTLLLLGSGLLGVAASLRQKFAS